MDESDQKRDRILKAALEYRVELLAYARSLLGNYTAAENAVQDAMLVVVSWTSKPGWKSPRSSWSR